MRKRGSGLIGSAWSNSIKGVPLFSNWLGRSCRRWSCGRSTLGRDSLQRKQTCLTYTNDTDQRGAIINLFLLDIIFGLQRLSLLNLYVRSDECFYQTNTLFWNILGLGDLEDNVTNLDMG